MSSPVFAKSDSQLNGIFTANDAALLMTPNGLIGCLVQSMQFNYRGVCA